VIAHPLARIRFDNARVPAAAMIGAPGEGFKIAMATLDVFRTTVGAAALGFARRALDEATARAQGRKLFGAPSMKRQSNCRSCRPSLRNPRGRRRSVASWK
jgi:acyl-CoA dehydrogenase